MNKCNLGEPLFLEKEGDMVKIKCYEELKYSYIKAFISTWQKLILTVQDVAVCRNDFFFSS